MPVGTSQVRHRAGTFIGRERELAELRASLEEAAAGRGGVVVITGDAGIGKTRLLKEFAAQAGEGCQVLTGRCWEEGGAPAYWPWIQVIRGAGGDFSDIATASRDSVQHRDPEGVRFALFDAVAGFLFGLDEPTLIVLEDLHAADEPSLLLLRFLGEATADSRVLLVCSYRDTEPGTRELAGVLAGIARLGPRLTLEGLTDEEVKTYVAGVAGEAAAPTLAVRLRAVTGGNPFFLDELLRAGADVAEPSFRIPEEVRVVIRRRIDGLSPEAVSLLQLAAVGGRELDLAVLERMSRLTPSDLVGAIGEAVDACVLVESLGGGGHAFAHELMRATIYDDLSVRRRHELHLGMGTVLEDLGRGDLDRRL